MIAEKADFKYRHDRKSPMWAINVELRIRYTIKTSTGADITQKTIVSLPAHYLRASLYFCLLKIKIKTAIEIGVY